MVTKMSAPGRSFGGVADYCLHDGWVPGQVHHITETTGHSRMSPVWGSAGRSD